MAEALNSMHPGKGARLVRRRNFGTLKLAWLMFWSLTATLSWQRSAQPSSESRRPMRPCSSWEKRAPARRSLPERSTPRAGALPARSSPSTAPHSEGVVARRRFSRGSLPSAGRVPHPAPPVARHTASMRSLGAHGELRTSPGLVRWRRSRERLSSARSPRPGATANARPCCWG